MSGYGVPVGLDEPASGEQCPQCGETDLRPYGNGSKWACPGVTSSCRAVRAANWPCGLQRGWDGERRWRIRGGRAQGRPVPAGGCRLGSRIVTSLVAQVSQMASEAEAPLEPLARTLAYPDGGLPARGEPTGEPTVTGTERRQATSSPVSVQLNCLSGHTQRLLAKVKVCLQSSGSRVRIL